MENGNGEKIEKWWESRLTFTLTVGGVLVSAVLAIFIPIWQLKTQIAVMEKTLIKIETNDLAHINTRLDKNEEEHKEILEKLTKLITLFEENRR